MDAIKRYLTLDLPRPYSTFLWGARKTGKSTYLRECYPKSLFIDFLQTDTYQHFLNRPHLLREELLSAPDETFQHPVILDEIQKIPPLLDEVHWLMENKKEIQFILCGSSVRKLKQSGSNLLGGRAWRTLFMPFCFPELKTLNWNKIMNHGLIPSHYFATQYHHAQKQLSSYVYDYLLPEVQLEANLRSSQGFSRFLDTLGYCQGELLNYNNIARDCGVDSKTVKIYFEILVDMYLGYFVYPCSKKSTRDVIRETPKFYLMDTGISHYLKKYKFTEFKGADSGKAFEHYVLLELMAHRALNDLRHNIQFWRTTKGDEVDFILDDGAIAIECKIATAIEGRDFKGLLKFGKDFPDAKLYLVCLELTKRTITVGEQKITIWPIQDFLESLWQLDGKGEIL